MLDYEAAFKDASEEAARLESERDEAVVRLNNSLAVLRIAQDFASDTGNADMARALGEAIEALVIPRNESQSSPEPPSRQDPEVDF